MVPAGPAGSRDRDPAGDPIRPLILTPGDPLGIGPEVLARTLVARNAEARPVHGVVVGQRAAFEAAAEQAGLAHYPLVEPEGHEPVEVAALRYAAAEIGAGRARGLVTGPIHKARLAARGFAYTGHTDFLAHLCGVERPVMAFVGGRVAVALVTVHLPLRRVPDAVTAELVLHTVRTSAAALQDQLGLDRPRLLVCGLNPHAGDEGLLGHEDAAQIAPAVAAARAEGLDAVGPISAEAAFHRALAGDGDLVVAMYHDQGLAPLKALDFGRTVNWTLGLPWVRTSVDHGTADDLVGTGRADPASMGAAIALAERLTSRG